ncbi:MAG: sulfotransferase [Porticoccaceae bacterium]|nr:sulfotransferase [Porticoccaceae bacterium]
MYGKPYQSNLVRAWNVIARVLPGIATPDLTLDSLLFSARRQAKSDDFGSDTFDKPLLELLNALNTDHNLHAFGRFYIKQMLVGLLANRAKLVALWEKQPEILEIEVAAPLIVLGLPRTGTSFLFDLLAEDPSHRYLTNWEATVGQVPPPGDYSWDNDPRRRLGRYLLRFQNYLIPQMKEIHTFHLDGPEECTSLLMQGFSTLAIAAMFNVPAYSQWLTTADHEPTYEHFKKTLQTLQWKYPGERWLLKSPSHIDAVDSILKVFPDARFVQTHRDPVKAVASFASLCAAFRGLYSTSVDMHKVGEQALDRLATDFDSYLGVREACGNSNFVDLLYRDLVAEPLATVGSIYEHFSMPISPVAEANMAAYLDKEREGGGHQYKPEDFGLSAEGIRDRFRAYIDRFNIPLDS